MTTSAPLPPLDSPSHPRLERVALWIGLALGLALILGLHVGLSLSVNWVSDDAFISYRFARHLAEGHGLVWNIGETLPVEGYSNFLYVIILALIQRLGAPIIIGSIWFNLACSCLTIVLACRLTRALAPQIRSLSLVPPLLLALNANFRYWSVGGLETHLYTTLISGVALLLVTGWPKLRPGRLAAISVLLALTALTRPEGMGLFAGVAGGLTAWSLWPVYRRKAPLAAWPLAALWMPFLVIVGAHFLWRLAYYHAPLPNTYYAKTGGDWWQWRRGLGYFWHYFKDYDTLLLPLLLTASVFLWRGAIWLVVALAGLLAAAVVYVGGDALMHYRFIVPLLPLTYVALAFSLHRVQAWLRHKYPKRTRGLKPALWLFVLVLGGLIARGDTATYAHRLGHLYGWARHGGLVAFGGGDIDSAAEGARYLAGHLPLESVLAINLIGRYGYYTELTILDRLGLCDRHIARVDVPDMGHHLAGHEKRDPAYVFAQRPEVILPGSNMVLALQCPTRKSEASAPDRSWDFEVDWAPINLLPGDRELAALPGFWDVYRPEVIPIGNGLFLHLLLRKDVRIDRPALINRRRDGSGASEPALPISLHGCA